MAYREPSRKNLTPVEELAAAGRSKLLAVQDQKTAEHAARRTAEITKAVWGDKLIDLDEVGAAAIGVSVGLSGAVVLPVCLILSPWLGLVALAAIWGIALAWLVAKKHEARAQALAVEAALHEVRHFQAELPFPCRGLEDWIADGGGLSIELTEAMDAETLWQAFAAIEPGTVKERSFSANTHELTLPRIAFGRLAPNFGLFKQLVTRILIPIHETNAVLKVEFAAANRD